MKKRNLLCIIAVMSCLLILLAVPCRAINTGFVLEDVSEEEKENYIASLNLKPVDAPIKNTSFYCFDVNEKGQYAIGYNGPFVGHVVNVYDADGAFLYGFSFSTYGAYSIQWDGENIIIYLVRGNLAFAIDPDITCVEVASIPDNADNQKYWRREVDSVEREVNGVTYQAKAKLSSYHWKLVAVSPDGTETVLFHAPGGLEKIITLILFVVLFGVIVVIVLSYSLNKKYRNYKETKMS